MYVLPSRLWHSPTHRDSCLFTLLIFVLSGNKTGRLLKSQILPGAAKPFRMLLQEGSVFSYKFFVVLYNKDNFLGCRGETTSGGEYFILEGFYGANY